MLSQRSMEEWPTTREKWQGASNLDLASARRHEWPRTARRIDESGRHEALLLMLSKVLWLSGENNPMLSFRK
jgi:hypothetical protein